MKINKLLIICLIVFSFTMFWSCTEPTKPNSHPSEWMESGQENFHGDELALKGYPGIESCKSCHGEFYFGGTSSTSCYQCHKGGVSGHPDKSEHLFYINEENTDFHGYGFTAESFDEKSESCIKCHGILDGGKVDISCSDCHNLGNPFFD